MTFQRKRSNFTHIVQINGGFYTCINSSFYLFMLRSRIRHNQSIQNYLSRKVFCYINTIKCIEYKKKFEPKSFVLLLVVCIPLHACTNTLSKWKKNQLHSHQCQWVDDDVYSHHRTEFFSSIDICTIFY